MKYKSILLFVASIIATSSLLMAQCPTTISVSTIAGCGIYQLHLNEFGDSGNIVWTDENGQPFQTGINNVTWATETPGLHNICAHAFTAACPDGVEICTQIDVPQCPAWTCPTFISVSETNNCHEFNFEIGTLVEGESVQWYFDNEPVVYGGHAISHSFVANGTHTICAYYSSPSLCVNGVELCTTITVNCQTYTCATSIFAEQTDCNSYVFHTIPDYSGDVVWSFGDATSESAGIVADHTYAQDGVYVITALYASPNCPDGILLYYTLNVDCTPEVICPTAITSSAGSACGVMNFEIGSFVEGESVIWYPGDESGAQTGGHFFTHTYAPGTYHVCAFYTTPACPDGVELCIDIVVESCNTNICPTEIYAYQIDCNSFVFHTLPDFSGDVVWSFGDATSESAGNAADHTYAQDGVYVITALYASPNCPEGVLLYYTLIVDCIPEVICPTAITSSAGTACGVMNFEIGSFVEGESVIWYPGDDSGAQTGGHFFTHTYAPGTYQVCAFYTSPTCPNGVELCTVIVVESCNATICPTEIVADQIDCNSFVFHIAGVNEGQVTWVYGNSASQSGGINADHSFLENGVYNVYAEYFGPNCQDGITLVYTVTVDCNSTPDCPTSISSSAGSACGVMNFEIGSFVDGESVIWYPGDDSGAQTGGHFFTHTYAPGSYHVCAFYTTPACPDGVELCTDIVVNDCNILECPTYIYAEQSSCNSYVFQVAGVNDGNVIWTFGSNTVPVTSGIVADHAFLENGVYVISAQYFGPYCQSGVTLYYTISVDCNGTPECPTAISSNAGTACGMMNFEIGSFVEGESVIWYPGDESGAVTAGHTFSHVYANPGNYTVCANYTSPNCPDGVELCTEIVVQPCESTCTDVTIGIDSYVNAGGTPELVYSISNAETNEMVLFETVNYTEADPYYDHAICLPDGCYYLTIDNNNNILLGEGVNVYLNANGLNLMENAQVVYQDNISFSILFGVNSDCTPASSCEASFTPVFTNTQGHIEFQNTSTFDGTATYLWSYGNDTYSDGQGGNVTYTANGVYEVCLTITTATCEDTYCFPVSVQNLETGCTDNLVTLNIQTEYSSLVTDLVSIEVLFENNPVFSQTIPMTQGFNSTLSVCIPDGCYELNMSTETPLLANLISAQILNQNIPVDVLQLINNSTSGSLTFGLNSECTPNSITESTSSEWLIYPNPVQHDLNIQSLSGKEIKRIVIADATGRLVMDISPNRNASHLDIQSLNSGIYSIRITDGETTTVKLIEIVR